MQSIPNSALVYLKPLSNNNATQLLVQDWLKSKGFRITFEAEINGEKILHTGLFDKQYVKMSEFAILASPSKLVLSSEIFLKFHKKFGITWTDALRKGIIMNALDSAGYLELDHEELANVWNESCNQGKLLKLDRGIYLTLIDTVDGKAPIFCINGFYMAMRNSFVSSEACIHVFIVEWEEVLMNWKAFRYQVIGQTDPKLARSDSLRGILFAHWEELGLSFPPDIMNNGIHASSSAFEAMVEKSNWLQRSVSTDILCENLVNLGIPYSVVKKWCKNPTLKGKSIFDHMKLKGCDECVKVSSDLFSIAEGIVLFQFLIHISSCPF